MKRAFASLLVAFLLVRPAFASPALERLSSLAGTDSAAVPAAVLPPAPLFPEDGSVPMRAWYTSFAGGHPSPLLRSALEKEGVELREIGFSYDWIQDIALFGSDGSLVLQAEVPGDILEGLGLTMGVLSTEDGFPRLTALSAEDAESLGVPYRRMEWTFLEGGGLISGTIPDGSPYAIVTRSPVEGAARLYQRRKGRAISEAEARDLVARDLRVPGENLFVADASGHLDLVVTPLPGGVIVLSDPSATPAALREILAAGPPPGEKPRLESMLELYEKGWQPLYSANAPASIAGKPMGPRRHPYDKYDLRKADNIAAAVEGRLRVVRAPGVFKELETYANSSDSFYIADRINFFNGFTGMNARGEVFQMTNSTRGLASLENYWAALLGKHGAGRVHFPGSYGHGAGLDCRGAPSGR
ncbi:MAG: Uncharacterized protein FD189_1785 [Elusimicrobia bacterium]|nr:MAG: Uncharacterized protein FD154_1928 [Elusimicrobiota bacterium]KAF0154601.1 MAG: Uncharacterized protein FD189_1785 [Elusimicrobiota bacterium]